MRYLVVLDARSAIGMVYLAGTHDGLVGTGDQLQHPSLDCTEVVFDAGAYLLVTRDLSRHGGHHQTLHIPHSAVVFVLQYAEETRGEDAFGFARGGFVTAGVAAPR